MAAHSFLPPSGASGWLRCAQWPTMNARYPQDDSPESLEGSAAHWAAWEWWADRKLTINAQIPYGLMVTDEMLDAAELLCDTMRERGQFAGDWHIEEQLPITEVNSLCFGTPDAWAWHSGNAHLEIIDYKFGHRFVDEYFNPQGILYMLGILAKLKFVGDPLNITVSFTIVQPRCYYKGEPVRTHSYVIRDALGFIDELKDAANFATNPNPVATTNEYCINCPGRHSCDALQKAVYSDAEFSTVRQPLELAPNAAALELRMLERALNRLEARVDGLRELTLNNIKAGIPIAYYRVEPTKPRQQWTIPTEQIITIGQMMGKELAKPGVVTPQQAIKLGIDANVISAYSQTPAGALKLVAENPNDVRKVFG